MKSEQKDKQYPGVGSTDFETFSTDPEMLRKRKWKRVFLLIVASAIAPLIGVGLLVISLLST